MPALLPSDKPVVGGARYHWITVFSKPPRWLWVTMLALLILAVMWPWPMIVPFAVMFGFDAFLRWQYWREANVVLTQCRIIRCIGVPEWTSAEASMRLDRIHGLVIEQTALGKILDYGTIELESPVKNNDLQKLSRIKDPQRFYRLLQVTIYGSGTPDDPDYRPEHHTAPLPALGGRSADGRLTQLRAKLPELRSKLTGRED